MKSLKPNRFVRAELSAVPPPAQSRPCTCGELFYAWGDKCSKCIAATQARVNARRRAQKAARRGERKVGTP